jgi:hypothetical protein
MRGFGLMMESPHPNLTARPATGGWIAFLAHFLFILSAWTVVIKYLFPMAFATIEGVALTTYVFWDAWPVFHVWLGWALLRQPSHTRLLAISMSAIEIVIIITLFYRFLSGPDPEWSIWRTNWFINKIFVLSCFFLILGTFLFRPAKKPAPSGTLTNLPTS